MWVSISTPLCGRPLKSMINSVCHNQRYCLLYLLLLLLEVKSHLTGLPLFHDFVVDSDWCDIGNFVINSQDQHTWLVECCLWVLCAVTWPQCCHPSLLPPPSAIHTQYEESTCVWFMLCMHMLTHNAHPCAFTHSHPLTTTLTHLLLCHCPLAAKVTATLSHCCPHTLYAHACLHMSLLSHGPLCAVIIAC